MPCDNTGSPLFPHCSDPFELWPFLLCKAVLKLLSGRGFDLYNFFHNHIRSTICSHTLWQNQLTHLLSGRVPQMIPTTASSNWFFLSHISPPGAARVVLAALISDSSSSHLEVFRNLIIPALMYHRTISFYWKACNQITFTQ